MQKYRDELEQQISSRKNLRNVSSENNYGKDRRSLVLAPWDRKPTKKSPTRRSAEFDRSHSLERQVRSDGQKYGAVAGGGPGGFSDVAGAFSGGVPTAPGCALRSDLRLDNIRPVGCRRIRCSIILVDFRHLQLSEIQVFNNRFSRIYNSLSSRRCRFLTILR